MEGRSIVSNVECFSLPIRFLLGGHRRMDGETYLTPGFMLRHQIEELMQSAPLSELARVWQPGRLKGIQVAPGRGAPFVTATQVFDIRPSPRKWLSEKRTPDLENRYLGSRWILVTCSGSVGDVIMSYAPHEDLVVSHDLLRVQPHNEGLLGYLYAYLRSSFGRSVMRSNRYGNIIKHLETEHLGAVPVPLIGDPALEAKLQGLIRLAFDWRDEAYDLERRAEDLYASHTGLTSTGSLEEAMLVRASDLFVRLRRLDGYHHNLVAASIVRAAKSAGLRLDPLHEIVSDVLLPDRFTRGAYVEGGLPYVDSEDIFKINPEVDKFLSRSVAEKRVGYHVKKGWLLMARSGQIYGLNGSVVLANEWHEGKILSEHVIRIVPDTNKIRPGYLRTVLGHPKLGRPLVLRCAFGTSVPEIPPAEVKLIPVVRLSKPQEDEISDMAEKASELRREADRAENEAVEKLEAAIAKAITSGGRITDPALADLQARFDKEGRITKEV